MERGGVRMNETTPIGSMGFGAISDGCLMTCEIVALRSVKGVAVAVVAFFLMSVDNGTADEYGNYCTDRADDLTDVMNVNASCFSCGLGVNIGPILIGGFRAGSIFGAGGMTAMGFGGMHYIGDCEYFGLLYPFKKEETWGSGLPGWRSEVGYGQHYPAWGSVGFDLGLLFGCGVRFDVVEAADFVLGWTGVDFLEDDQWARRKAEAAEANKVNEEQDAYYRNCLRFDKLYDEIVADKEKRDDNVKMMLAKLRDKSFIAENDYETKAIMHTLGRMNVQEAIPVMTELFFYNDSTNTDFKTDTCMSSNIHYYISIRCPAVAYLSMFGKGALPAVLRKYISSTKTERSMEDGGGCAPAFMVHYFSNMEFTEVQALDAIAEFKSQSGDLSPQQLLVLDELADFIKQRQCRSGDLNGDWRNGSGAKGR